MLNALSADYIAKNGTNGTGVLNGDFMVSNSLPTRMITDDGYLRNGLLWYGASALTMYSQRIVDGSYAGLVVGNMAAKVEARDYMSGLATGLEYLSDQLNLYTSNPAFKGIQGDADYSPYSDAFSFIQRVYVDNNFAPLVNADSILFNNTNGIDANNTLSIGETYATAIDFGSALTTHYFNGIMHIDRIRAKYGVDLTVVGSFLDFPSGGGIKNAQLYGCTFLSDLAFANSTGITNAGKLAIGDADGLYSGAGGTYNFFRMAGLSGNYGVSMNRFVQPTNGGFNFVSAPGYYGPNRYSYITPDDRFQLFGDGGWEMPIGGGLRLMLDCTKTFNSSPTYDQAELVDLINDYSDTKRTLAAVIQHLGNRTIDVGFDDSANTVLLSAHGLPGRHRIKFISGALPPELSYFTWYYVADSPNTDDFQLSASYGGSPINFSAPAPGADTYMQIENSGMNLLKD